MAIVKYKNQSGVTYAYESTSQWDPVKKQSRPVRKYLGRVDPETGEIVSTKGKRGRPKKNPDQKTEVQDGKDYAALYQQASEELQTVKTELERLEKENSSLTRRNSQLEKLVSSIHQQTGDALPENS